MKPVIDMEKEYGLVLEGGGAKGAYQIGAWRALREAGVKIRGVAGTSVGALNGALICMDDIERAEHLWKTISYSKVMDVDDQQMRNLFRMNLDPEGVREVLKDTFRILREGGTDITPLRNLIDENIDEDKIRNSPTEFYSCTFSLTDHQEMLLDMRQIPEGHMKDMLIASSYLPVFKNVKMGGKTYLDGGVTNVLPVNSLLEHGYKDIILLRIFGIGWEKRVDIPEDVNIYEIAPKVPLGSILQFDAARSQRNMKIGYYDALRLIYGLAGKIYYIEQSHEEWYYLTRLLETDPRVQMEILAGYKLAEDPSQRLRNLTEVVFPLMAGEMGLSKTWTYEELYLAMLEQTARDYRIPKYELYTADSLLERIKKKAEHGALPEEMPEYMRFVLNR